VKEKTAMPIDDPGFRRGVTGFVDCHKVRNLGIKRILDDPRMYMMIINATPNSVPTVRRNFEIASKDISVEVLQQLAVDFPNEEKFIQSLIDRKTKEAPF
jgi:hypothetical protein